MITVIVVPRLAAHVSLRISYGGAHPRRIVGELEPDIAPGVSQVIARLGANQLADAHLHRGVVRPLDVDEPVDISHIQCPAATGGKDKRASNRGVIHHVVAGRALRLSRPDHERQRDGHGCQRWFRHTPWMEGVRDWLERGARCG